MQYFSNEQCFLEKSRADLRASYFSCGFFCYLFISISTVYNNAQVQLPTIPDDFVNVQLDLSSSFWCLWGFAISCGGNGVFPFFPCQTNSVPGLLHMLNLLTTSVFACATPSCSSIPSWIFFPLTFKCFYHLLCLQLLFRASLLYSVFHPADTIISKLTNFLFNNSRQCYCLFCLIS